MPSPSRQPDQEPGRDRSRVAFDQFELDLRSGELRKDGRKIRLQAQPFQLLALLVENSGEVVTREQIYRALWPANTFVDFDHGLAVAVNKIREALNDSAENARFIETLPKRGYRFISPVREIVGSRTALPEPYAAELSRSDAQFPPPERQQPESVGQHESSTTPRRLWFELALTAVVLLAVVVLFAARARRKPAPFSAGYTQLTNFSDAAFAPAISPDGHMIAFLRGSAAVWPFPTISEVYSKILPDGEPVQLTRDGWPKYGITFSPDGAWIAYTAAETRGWDTDVISPMGGEPRLFLSNAAGLTWLDDRHLLFSEIETGLHMGVVTSNLTRGDPHTVYIPSHARAMAHYSYASPDSKWVLIVQMGGNGAWNRCRVVPFDGSSVGRQVGPDGACTAAAWSRDGRWMYFSAYVNGASHLWRQSFPNGQPEQITFGPTEEAGVAVMPDGRSLVSAVGMRESGVWMHDSRGEHLISSEGYASQPSFSRDGRRVYYLLRRESPDSPQELWVTNLASGKTQPVVDGFSIGQYDVSPDGKEVVFTNQPPGEKSQIWLASLDQRFAPRLLTSSGENMPYFGPDHDVLFVASEQGNNYLFRMRLDGSGRTKVLAGPVIYLKGMSPNRRWAVVMVPVSEVPTTAVMAVPLGGGRAKRICPAECMVKWSPDGARFYVEPLLQNMQRPVTLSIPVPRGQSLPNLPPYGIRSARDSTALPGTVLVDLFSIDPGFMGWDVVPGMTAHTFAYAKTSVHSNLFQIPLP